MNIIYITAILSVLLLLVFVILSVLKSNNLSFQVIYIVVASFNIGVIASLILLNYDNKSALVWPALLLLHVLTKVVQLRKSIKQYE